MVKRPISWSSQPGGKPRRIGLATEYRNCCSVWRWRCWAGSDLHLAHLVSQWVDAGVRHLGPLPIFALFLSDRKIIGAVKARVTYPRTGYVHPPHEGRQADPCVLTLLSGSAGSVNQNMSSFRMGTIYFFVVGAMMVNLLKDRWGIAVVMGALGFLVYFGRRWSERPYSWWSTVILAVSGVPFSVIDVPARGQYALVMLLSGVWLLGQGGCTLIHYLSKSRMG